MSEFWGNIFGGGQTDQKDDRMPKVTEREKLADLDKRQRALAQEADGVRRALRLRYGSLLADMPVEALSEREFRDLLTHAIRVGGAAAIPALKALPSAPS